MVQQLWKTAWQLCKKLNTELPRDPVISFLGMHTQQNRKLRLTNFYATVHSDIIHISQKVGTTQVSIN